MSVLVIGAGIAGLTVAHELAARGIRVRVIEAGPEHAVGGKCRSQYWSDPGFAAPLAGEHGYRFFPGFYRQVPDLMARIPADGEGDPKTALRVQPNNVAQHLKPAESMGVCFPNRPMVVVPLGQPANVRGTLERMRAALPMFAPMRNRDFAYIAKAMHVFQTMCEGRREAELENLSLWEHMQATRLSEETQKLLQLVPRGLVGMNAKQGSARTFLNMLLLMMSEWTTTQTPHRVLDGPTSEVWLYPWLKWLRKLGVEFEFDTRAVEVLHETEGDYDKGRIIGVRLQGPAGERVETADHYVLATPLEITQRLVTPSMRRCKHCRNIADTNADRVLGTMSGVQLYLRKSSREFRGHFSLPASPFGLTGIWQDQFWREDIRARWPGAAGILSMIVTDWSGVAHGTKRAGTDMTRQEIVDAIVAQLRDALQPAQSGEANPMGLIEPEDVLSTHIDDAVEFDDKRMIANHARLLIHPPGFWHTRAEAKSQISNLYLAGDHVKTPIDLATMEGAVASASQVANAILDADEGARSTRIPIHNVRLELESDFYRRRKQLDEKLFAQGMRPLPLANDALALHFDVPDTDDWDALNADFEAFERSLERGLSNADIVDLDP